MVTDQIKSKNPMSNSGSQSELQRRFFKDFGGGPLILIHDFVATFGVNNRPIYMALGS